MDVALFLKLFVSPSCESSTERMEISDIEEWPNMPDSFISEERTRQRKIRKMMKSTVKSDLQLLPSPPDEGPAVLSPPHLTEEEESVPLVDLAVKIKNLSKRPSQPSQKPKKAGGSRVKCEPTEIPAPLTEEVPKKQEASGSSKKNKKKREVDGERGNKPKREHSAKKKNDENLEVTEPIVEEQQQQQHEAVVEKMEVDEEKDTFQPRSLRLRLTRQDDGNLTVVDEKSTSPTQAQLAPKSPIKLRLSLTPVKPEEIPTTTTSMTTEALLTAFPNAKCEDINEIPLPHKKSRPSSKNKPTERELLITAKSLLTSSETEANEEVGKSASPRTIKKHFMHRVLKKLTKPVLNEASTSDVIPANVAREVYNRLEPVLTNWARECTEIRSEKLSKSSSKKSMKKM